MCAEHATQVKVFLGDHMEHHYVLSRFLISRMLTVTRIPNSKVISVCVFVCVCVCVCVSLFECVCRCVDKAKGSM
jgi:hypothetical protein